MAKVGKSAAIVLLSAAISLIGYVSLIALLLGAVFLKPAVPNEVQFDFSGDSVTFAAFGDYGMGNYRQWQVARALNAVAEQRGIDFVALLGDNFYRYGVSETDDLQWRYKFENMYSGEGLNTVPFYAVLGNHDYYGNEAAMIEYSQKQLGSGRWQLPATDYVQYYGKSDGQHLLRIVFLETSAGVRRLRYMAQELDWQLKNAEPAQWTVVATHQPLRSAGLFYHSAAVDAYRKQLLPVLQKHKVNAYFSGHHHNQQLLAYPEEPVYVISGAGGKYGDELDMQYGESLKFGGLEQGFALVEVTADQFVVEFIGVDNKVLYRHEL